MALSLHSNRPLVVALALVLGFVLQKRELVARIKRQLPGFVGLSLVLAPTQVIVGVFTV